MPLHTILHIVLQATRDATTPVIIGEPWLSGACILVVGLAVPPIPCEPLENRLMFFFVLMCSDCNQVTDLLFFSFLL
jgi:hypothetical protein